MWSGPMGSPPCGALAPGSQAPPGIVLSATTKELRPRAVPGTRPERFAPSRHGFGPRSADHSWTRDLLQLLSFPVGRSVHTDGLAHRHTGMQFAAKSDDWDGYWVMPFARP